jgi:hypothetical protein
MSNGVDVAAQVCCSIISVLEMLEDLFNLSLIARGDDRIGQSPHSPS